MSKLAKAIQLATEAHDGTPDKAGFPYIIHPLSVMRRVSLWLGPDDPRLEDALCAAVLHDVHEDCGISIQHIRVNFGNVIAELVDALSRRDGESYGDFIKRVVAAGLLAMIIKCCDMEDNFDEERASYLSTRQRDYFQKKYREHYAVLHELATAS